MKKILLCLLALPTLALATSVIETKVCTVFHEDHATSCVSTEKKTYPTTVLYGISKIAANQPMLRVGHRWNERDVAPTATMGKDRVVVSSFTVPQGFSGDVVFSVHGLDGQVIAHRAYEVKHGGLNIEVTERPTMVARAADGTAISPAAGEEGDMVWENKPEAPANPDLQKIIAAPLVERSAEASPPKTLPSTPPRENRDAGQPAHSPAPTAAQAQAAVDSKAKLAQFELHGGYLRQKGGGDAYSPILYWAPEYQASASFGLGARLGGTQWKDADEKKKLTAFESDLHLSFTLASPQGSLTLQPAVGYHSWAKVGAATSFGGNLLLSPSEVPVYVIFGAQAWKHDGQSYTLLTAGLGYHF